MVSVKKLIKMARRWQKFAVNKRKRISFPRSNYHDAESCSTSSSIVGKGHFVVYTTDQKRLVVPLAYLQHEVIRQLLHMSEEEFGLPSDGPITLPCDALFMNYIISLIRRGVAADLQNALLVSVASSQCSSALYHFLTLQSQSCDFTAPFHFHWTRCGVHHFLILHSQSCDVTARFTSIRQVHHDAESCSTSSSIVGKGHFAVYTADQKRFVVPLAYLQHEVMRQLLHMSEEEFGLPSDGPITLPCDALFMNYIISLFKRGVAADLQNALLVSVASSRCSSALFHISSFQASIIHIFNAPYQHDQQASAHGFSF